VKEAFKPVPDVKLSEDETKSKSVKDETVSLSEHNSLKKQLGQTMEKVNELSNMLIAKADVEKHFSEQMQKMADQTRTAQAEAICEKALLDGVPPVVINTFKPVLMSEMGEKIIKLSEVVDNKTVEAEKSIKTVIADFFGNYPSKINFSDRTKTKLTEPGNDDDKQDKAYDEKFSEYKKSMPAHEAATKAAIEIYGGKS
jgi:hypothetical protein